MSEFAMNNPGTTMICFIIACYAATRPFRYAAMVLQRMIRSRDIQVHGWPTAPVDADGDIIQPEKVS